VTKSPFSLRKAPWCDYGMPKVTPKGAASARQFLINELIKGTWVAGGNNLFLFLQFILTD